MPGRRSCLLTVLATVCGFLVATGVGEPALAATADLVNEPFTNATTTASTWVLPAAATSTSFPTQANDACLTASSNTSQTPIPGCAMTSGGQAGLQLTTNALTQEGGLAYSSSVPSSLGLDVTFNSYQYQPAGTPTSAADGIVFFLAASDPTNASSSPITLGEPGGYLGYSGNAGTGAGLTRGYLGVGLDVFGNYSNPGIDGSGCTGDPTSGQTPESVTVRGPGNGTTGYCMLSTSLAGDPLDSSTPQAVPVEVAVNPTGSALTDAGGFSVPGNSYVVQWTPIGASSALTQTAGLPSASGFVPDSSWLDGNGVPLQLSFGWSAATGASTDYHTISNVDVRTLNGTPPTLAVGLTDNSGGTARSGATVTYLAKTTLTGSPETRTITLTDTFPAGLTPETPQTLPSSPGPTGTGWSCGVTNVQVVTCTRPPTTPLGPLPGVTIPVLVSIPPGTPPTPLADSATAGAPDATQGTGTDTETYSAAPTATVLSIIGQPVNSQVNAPMTNADNTTTHIRVAADVTAGGAVDTTYTGNVTLSISTNPPGNGSFVVNHVATPTITVAAVAGIADFSPIVVNAVGFGYKLTASATGLTSATTTSFDVNGVASSCPTGQSCTVKTTSTGGQTASVQALAGTGNAIITATFGGNVAAIHPCTGATSGVLTFSGNRQKLITLTLPIKQLSLVFCYGQPTPFLDILYRPTTYFSPVNQEYEGLLPLCLPKFTGPCVKSLSLSKTAETVVIQSGTADPRVMG
jgi:hypothetical protein